MKFSSLLLFHAASFQLRRERFAKVRARPANAEDVATLAKQEVEFYVPCIIV